MKKRIFATALALLMLLPLVISCGQTEKDEKSETTAAAATSGTPEETTESLYDENSYLKDEIPEDTNLNAVKLQMLYWDDASAPEFFVEDTNGDFVNDAIFNRNAKVNERLNCSFEYTGIHGNNSNRQAFLTAAQTAANSNQLYDIYAAYSMTTAMLAYNGLCENLLSYPVIDLEKPWWPDSLTTEATINNKLYFLSGDISTNLIYTMYAIYFNSSLISSYNLENPYDCVNSNTWTFEKMFNMAKAAEATSVGTETFYGFTVPSNVYVDPFFFAAGLRTVVSDDSGKLVISESFHNETAEDVASQVWDFLHQSYSKIDDSKYDAFMTEKCIFTMTTCLFSKTMLADSSIKYGIVPVPKYSSEQENYTTLNGFTYTLYAISSFSEHKQEAAVALECMGSESYRTITPALFEITMKLRYAENSDASRMFDIIRESVTFDVGRIFTSDLEKLTYNIFRDNVSGSTKTSYLTSFTQKKRILQKKLDALNEVFSK